MKLWRLCAIVATFTIGVTAAASNGAAQTVPPGATPESPVYFEETSGAPENPIRYSARAGSYDLFLSREEADVVLHGGLRQSGEVARGKVIVVRAYASVLRMRFVDANPPTSVGPLEQKRGARHSCAALAYRGVYPGVDVVLRGDQRRIAFQLNLSPGADSAHIVLQLAGATSIELDRRGNAIVHAGRESLRLQRPVVKFDAHASGSSALGAYKIERGNRLRFVVVAPAPLSDRTISD